MKYSQSNLEQLFQLIGSMPNQEYGRTAHFDYIKTAASAWPNQLINFRTEGKEIIHILNQIEKDALTGRIPALLMLNPSKDENLSKEPFIRKKYSSSVWTAMTHNLQFISPQKQIENFHIKLIDNGDDLKLWLALVASELMNDHPLNTSVFNALLNHKDFDDLFLILKLPNNFILVSASPNSVNSEKGTILREEKWKTKVLSRLLFLNLNE